MKTPVQQAVALFEARDSFYEQAKTARKPANGVGLSSDAWAYFQAAEKAHQEAQAILAALHPTYRAAPWDTVDA